MYFKTQSGPVHVSPLAIQNADRAFRGDSQTAYYAPYYQNIYVWLGVAAVITIIGIIVCMTSKRK